MGKPFGVTGDLPAIRRLRIDKQIVSRTHFDKLLRFNPLLKTKPWFASALLDDRFSLRLQNKTEGTVRIAETGAKGPP
jgi:hypothetical protein